MSANQEHFDAMAARCMALAKEREPLEAIAKEGMAAELEEARQEVGYYARVLVQATLPHSKPKPGINEFKRTNGYLSVKVIADSDYGLPYGHYPRLLLSWATTEAVRTKSREIMLGDSLRDFMERLGISPGGAQTQILKGHMRRLFTSNIHATYIKDGEEYFRQLHPIDEAVILWDPKRPNQTSLWKSAIKLHPTFYEEVIRNPVPIDLAALRELAKSRSSLAIDVYMWLTHRYSYLRKPTTIPWEALALQFGGDYGRTRAFKEKLTKRLRQVVEMYPQAKVEPCAAGLKLWPSKTHVPMRLLKGRG